MSGTSNIQYLKQGEIDKTKWDNCIAKSSNGLIYCYSFYLDHMAKQWDALIMNDYETVMPLAWNKKFGINYLYQPFLVAQSGIVGNSITSHTIHAFINAIPKSFRFIDISMNYKNIDDSNPKFSIRKNYVLDLNNPYENLFFNYKENIQRNIKKSIQLKYIVQTDFDIEKIIELAVAQMKSQGNEESENIGRFRKLYHYLYSRKMATTYGIFSPQNELLASCVFFFSHNRAYYILVGNNPNGRSTGASHALIDAFIKDHAGKNLLLDFEGSDIPNLALFYSSFGATLETYPALKINRLPFYLRWMKK